MPQKFTQKWSRTKNLIKQFLKVSYIYTNLSNKKPLIFLHQKKLWRDWQKIICSILLLRSLKISEKKNESNKGWAHLLSLTGGTDLRSSLWTFADGNFDRGHSWGRAYCSRISDSRSLCSSWWRHYVDRLRGRLASPPLSSRHFFFIFSV